MNPSEFDSFSNRFYHFLSFPIIFTDKLSIILLILQERNFCQILADSLKQVDGFNDRIMKDDSRIIPKFATAFDN